MATGIDIWISKPGSACAVDDHSWDVTIDDAHNVAYNWAGTSYAAMPAPNAHWAGAIPPGTYVVHARRSDGSLSTDHAITVIEPGEVKSVVLWVAGRRVGGGDRPSGGGRHTCEVSIDEVRAQGVDLVDTITVSGTASGCDQVEVIIDFGGQDLRAKVSVKGGRWTLRRSISKQEVKCGQGARITVVCREDESCRTTRSVDLVCEPR